MSAWETNSQLYSSAAGFSQAFSNKREDTKRKEHGKHVAAVFFHQNFHQMMCSKSSPL